MPINLTAAKAAAAAFNTAVEANTDVQAQTHNGLGDKIIKLIANDAGVKTPAGAPTRCNANNADIATLLTALAGSVTV